MKLEHLPITFRAEIVKPVMDRLIAGESCSVVGIGSVGKSNLLRFLQREDVCQSHLGEDRASYLFVYVDGNKMLRQSWWGLLELMLHQLLIALSNHGAEEATLQTLDVLHQRATRPKTRRLTVRYLDRALGIICNQLALRLVFLIDEFDQLGRTMSAHGFAALRALRDEYKYQLVYLVATRLELKRLREELSEIEAFEELVSPHTFWLGPYSEDDARFMLRRLQARHDILLDAKTTSEVLKAAGGHPGLLREAFQVACDQPTNLFDSLASRPQVQDECQRIWLSLVQEEQQVLINLANASVAQPPQTAVAERLRHKGLIDGPWVAGNHLFSPLFATYVKKHQTSIGMRIYVDQRRHTVWVNGCEIRGLTPLEYKLMAYLAERPERVCSRDELAQFLYPDDLKLEGAGVTDNRIDSVVKRLRKRIEPDPKAPRYIVTARGHGFRLVGGG